MCRFSAAGIAACRARGHRQGQITQAQTRAARRFGPQVPQKLCRASDGVARPVQRLVAHPERTERWRRTGCPVPPRDEANPCLAGPGLRG